MSPHVDPTPGDDRRGFLIKAAAVLSAAAAYAVPTGLGLLGFLNPWRKGGLPTGTDRIDADRPPLVPVAMLSALAIGGPPQEFPVVAARQDAWTFSTEPVGRVFLVRTGKDRVRAFQVLCPHEGCPIKFHRDSGLFRLHLSHPSPVRPRRQTPRRALDQSPQPRRVGGERRPRGRSAGQVREIPPRHRREDCIHMSKLRDWIDQRTGAAAACRQWLDRPVGGGPAWRLVWPSTIAFIFFTQVITGLVLWMYYTPAAQSAWESVYYLQYHVQGGWLLRAVHHYAAQTMLVLVGIYLVHMIVCGVYRAPREVLFWTVVLMGLVTLALCLTGDLLPWDQNAYWSTHIRTGFLLKLPGVGVRLFELAAGGPDFGHLTLARFVALHAGVFSAAFALLLWCHARLARRHGLEGGTDQQPVVAYWPRQAFRDAVACLAVMAVVLALSLQNGLSPQHRGVTLGPPADPAKVYEAARPEWSFRGLFELRELFPARLETVPIFVLPTLVLLMILAMPWIGRIAVGRWFNVALIVVLLGGLGVLTWISLSGDARNKDYQQALAAARTRAERLKEQIAPEPDRPPEIPPAGALWLARRDARAVELFASCATCHDYRDGRDTFSRPAGWQPTAPDLYRFASRPWLAAFLDPKQISGPRFFGNTKFRRALMPSFVKNTLSKLDDKGKAELQDLIAALSAEAGLRSQRALDARDAAKIKAGRAALTSFGCTDCHKFRTQGQIGDAPLLTGYGSRSWLVGIISNPAHKRFYGTKNDRMPAYAATDDPAKNILSDEDIGLLADWLRGQ